MRFLNPYIDFYSFLRVCVCPCAVCTSAEMGFALLGRAGVGWAGGTASCSCVRTCLCFMWFTSRFPVYGFRINVHGVKDTWQDSCFILKILTRSVFLCLALACLLNSLLFYENSRFYQCLRVPIEKQVTHTAFLLPLPLRIGYMNLGLLFFFQFMGKPWLLHKVVCPGFYFVLFPK